MYKNFRVGGGIVLGLSALVLGLVGCSTTILRDSDNNIKKVINKGAKSFEKVTSLDQIEDGKSVLFVYNDSKFATSTLTSGYLKSGAIANAAEIVVEKIDTYYAFKINDKYINSSSSAKSIKFGDTISDNSKWILSINSTNSTVAIESLVKIGKDKQYLQYNPSSPRFTTYLSSSSQQNFSIYYEVPSVETYSVTFECEGQENKVSSVAYDAIPEQPTNPTKKSTKIYDYTFDGWYNKATNIKYNFDTALNADTTLVAKFIETKKTYENIFKQVYLSPSASLEYKYKATIGESGEFKTIVENGEKTSSDGYFTTTNTTTKSKNTNKLGFDDAKSSAHFSNGCLNSDVTLNFDYNITGSGSLSSLDIIFTYENGSTTLKVSNAKGPFNYNTKEDNLKYGYLTAIDFTTNKVSGSNVWLNTITVSGNSISVTKEYGYFANPAIITSFDYTGYEELTEVSEMGFACSETADKLSTSNISEIDSSVIKHSFDPSAIEGTTYSCGYKLSLETISDTYTKDYYFAVYFVISDSYYFSNVQTVNYKDALASTISKESKSADIITTFETTYGLAA